jgi:protocatechuate 3,4-dioxygenase beta subunit
MSRGLGVTALLMLALIGAALWWVSDAGRSLDPPGSGAGDGMVALPLSPQDERGVSEPSGAVETLDVPEQQPHAPEQRLETLRLSGRVVDARGRGLGGADVWLLPSSENRERLGLTYHPGYSTVMPWDALPHVRTAADGRFALDVQEVARASGHRPKASTTNDGGPTPLLMLRHPGFLAHVQTVPGPDWTVDLGDLLLEPSGVATGRAIDASGEPIPGLHVRIVGWNWLDSVGFTHWQFVRTLSVARTDEDGRFRLDVLPLGGCQLAVGGEGWRTAFRDLTTHPGELVELGAIEVARGAVLAGRVTDASGAAVPGAEMRARPSSIQGFGSDRSTDGVLLAFGTTFPESPGKYQRSAVTDEAGRFRFDDLDAERHDVFVQSPGHEPLASLGVEPDRDDLVLSLPPEALIVAHMVDEATGAPLEGVRVSARRHLGSGPSSHPEFDPSLTVVTGPAAVGRLGREGDGVGLFVAGPAGYLSNSLRLAWGAGKKRTLKIPGLQPGARHEQTVELPAPEPSSIQAGRASGAVRDTAGQPIEHVELTASPKGKPWGRRSPRAVSDEAGRFELHELQPGGWTIKARRSGFLDLQTEPFDLPGGEHHGDVVITLEPTARLSGVLLDPDGQPARLHEVEAWEADGSDELDTTLTDGQGRFLFDDLPPGAGEVRAHRGARADAQLVGGEEVQVELQLRESASLFGVVRDAAGRPVEAEVKVYSDDGAHWDVDTDEQGRYRFDDLPPVTGRVFARQSGRGYGVPAELQVARGEVRELDLVLGDGRLRGRVLHVTSGAALPGVKVSAYRDLDPGQGRGPKSSNSHATTDEAGRYELEGLLPGDHRVYVMGRDWVLPSGTYVPLAFEGPVESLDLEVEPSATLTGNVSAVGALDRWASLKLHLERLDGQGNTRTQRLRPGRDYSLRGFRAGRYRYRVTRQENPSDLVTVYARGEVTLSSGVTTVFDLLLEAEVAPVDR